MLKTTLGNKWMWHKAAGMLLFSTPLLVLLTVMHESMSPDLFWNSILTLVLTTTAFMLGFKLLKKAEDHEEKEKMRKIVEEILGEK